MTASEIRYIITIKEYSENVILKPAKLAKLVGCSRASVSKAIHRLMNKGIIFLQQNGCVGLTQYGGQLACAYQTICTLIQQELCGRLNCTVGVAKFDSIRIAAALSPCNIKKILGRDELCL